MFFDDAEAGSYDPSAPRGVSLVVGVSALVNSPLSYLVLIAPLTVAAAWAAKALMF